MTAAMPSVSAASPASPPPPSDSIVKVRISTDPDGATIKENGVSICSGTPCDVLYAGRGSVPRAPDHRYVGRVSERNEGHPGRRQPGHRATYGRSVAMSVRP